MPPTHSVLLWVLCPSVTSVPGTLVLKFLFLFRSRFISLQSPLFPQRRGQTTKCEYAALFCATLTRTLLSLFKFFSLVFSFLCLKKSINLVLALTQGNEELVEKLRPACVVAPLFFFRAPTLSDHQIGRVTLSSTSVARKRAGILLGSP